MKTVIMAGGMGTRIRAVANQIPKPMLKIEGVPVLEREIICLRDQGFSDFILTVSYMADMIIDYFGNGEKLGVNIEYFIERQPLGNAGALFKLRDRLDKTFLLLNADTVFDIDFNRFVNAHKSNGGFATIFTHPSSHMYDSSVIISRTDGSVKEWLAKEEKKPKWYQNRVNAGLHVIDPFAIDIAEININRNGTKADGNILKVDLDRQVLRPLCATGKVFCYDSPEYVKDMGTPERYELVCGDFRSGLIHKKNLRNKQKAIFLDRDGTINRYAGFLRNVEDFELLPDVAEAIKRINKSGYLAIVVSNQPVIARGEITTEELQQIHNKMETLLGLKGAYLDAIYYCPHHPDKGYDGEIPSLKIDCECRKPKPGMLLKAASEYNIDLEESWMIGDRENDIKAGKAAKCKTALIGNDEFGQDASVFSLLEWCNSYLKPV